MCVNEKPFDYLRIYNSENDAPDEIKKEREGNRDFM
jgi:hypothetical protein